MRTPLVSYALAGAGWYSVVPPVVVGVVLPIGLWFVRAGGSVPATSLYAHLSLWLLAPLFAAWWPVFAFKERLDGEGRELLYFLRRSGQGAAALTLGVGYLVLLVPLLAVSRGTPGCEASTIPLVLARCLAFTSLAFWAAFLTGSNALALVAALFVQLGLTTPAETFLGGVAMPGALGATPVPIVTVLAYLAVSAAMLAHGEAMGRVFRP